MVGEIFEYQYSEISKIALKFSTMVVEDFKYEYPEMTKFHLNSPL